jgi:cysteine desulfurase
MLMLMSTAPGAHPGRVGGPIYLDYNATTPVDPDVATAMAPWLTTGFGNPSSSHAYGESAHPAMARARRQVAELIGAAAGAGPPAITSCSGPSACRRRDW